MDASINYESPHRFVPGPDAPATLLHPSPVPGAPRLTPGFRYWGTPGKCPCPTYLSGRRTPGTRAARSRRAAAGGSKSPRPKPRRRRSCASSPGDVPGAGRSARPLAPRVGLRAGGRGKRGAGARRGRARRRGAGPGGVSRPASPMRLCSRSGVARRGFSTRSPAGRTRGDADLGRARPEPTAQCGSPGASALQYSAPRETQEPSPKWGPGESGERCVSAFPTQDSGLPAPRSAAGSSLRPGPGGARLH